MGNTLNYNFRVRGNADEICFGRGKGLGELEFDRFSLPPKAEKGDDEFVVIKRPPIPELDDFIEKYM